ncbi:hypothetical protein A5906_24780 [Bradyrhizobium sacchari]|nr:hypothetical protein A5906_24780 [Bradyrhizobium sacchari]
MPRAFDARRAITTVDARLSIGVELVRRLHWRARRQRVRPNHVISMAPVSCAGYQLEEQMRRVGLQWQVTVDGQQLWLSQHEVLRKRLAVTLLMRA